MMPATHSLFKIVPLLVFYIDFHSNERLELLALIVFKGVGKGTAPMSLGYHPHFILPLISGLSIGNFN